MGDRRGQVALEGEERGERDGRKREGWEGMISLETHIRSDEPAEFEEVPQAAFSSKCSRGGF